MIHPKCLPVRKPRRTQVETEEENSPKYTDFELSCPMCRHYCNMLLPCWKQFAREEKLKNTSLESLRNMIAGRTDEERFLTENDLENYDYLLEKPEEAEMRKESIETTSEIIFSYLRSQYFGDNPEDFNLEESEFGDQVEAKYS